MDNDSMDFESFLRRGSNYSGGEPEVYEDTHDATGRYIGRVGDYPAYGAGGFSGPLGADGVVDTAPKKPTPIPLPDEKAEKGQQLNSKFIIYSPRTTAEVEDLIRFLRRMEPALVDLDPVAGTPEGQRLMDFIAGAAFALGQTVMNVRPNLFLITPDTMDVYKPESNTDQ